MAAASALYEQLKTGNTNGGILVKLLHNLLVLLVRHEIKSVDKLACPTDVSLCLGSMIDKERCQPGNYITGDCAILQHNFFGIIFHYSRLLASNKPTFTPYDVNNFREPLGTRITRLHVSSALALPAEGASRIDEDGEDEDEDGEDKDEDGEDEDEDEDEEDEDEDAEDIDFADLQFPGQNLNGQCATALSFSLAKVVDAQAASVNSDDSSFDSILRWAFYNFPSVSFCF